MEVAAQLHYVIVYIVALRSLCFAFIHYQPAPHRIMMGLTTAYPGNILRFAYLAMLLSVFAAQVVACAKTVRQRRRVGR